MIATQNQPSVKNTALLKSKERSVIPPQGNESAEKIPALYLSSQLITHHPKAGLNLLVDSAGPLFSTLAKLRQLKSFRQLNKLQSELLQDINTFQEAVKSHGYNTEYTLVCRHIICATLDDIISNISWASQGRWDNYRLLATLNQDPRQQDKFFTVLDRVIKEPRLYIDLMELMYICLSLGYKGQYHLTEHRQYQLEQITNNLYKRIRAYRSSFNKSLSPLPTSTVPRKKILEKNNMLFIFFITISIILGIFIGLEHLLNLISNETHQHLLRLGKTIAYEALKY